MKLYPFPEKKIWKVLFAVYLFALLMLSRNGMLSCVLVGFYKTQILMLLVMGAGILTFAVVNRRELKQILTDRRMLAAAACGVLILLPMVVKRDWQLMYFSILIYLLFAVFLCYFVSMKDTAKYYVMILCALSVYAILATYVLRLLPDSGILNVHTFSNDKGRDYYNFGLAFVSITQVKERNFGIFREPGVYQYFLLLGLFLTNYTVEWKRSRDMWISNLILAVTMVTTMATGGVVCLGLLVIVVFFDKKMYRDKRVLWTAIGLATALVLVLAVSFATRNKIYWLVYNTLFEKFVNRSDSVTERTEAILVDVQIFLRHPIFGAGLSEVLHAVTNNTTSTLILYAVFGFLSGSLHVLAWVALVWKKERHLWANLALLVILFMGFNTQNLTGDVFFWLFPMMALLERGLPLLKKPGKG
ncbi:MAG: O-antigen ligase family protein [Clostridiales bacterium]|nr:O-antigen ligase family protein [Clostridiales bacterium]